MVQMTREVGAAIVGMVLSFFVSEGGIAAIGLAITIVVGIVLGFFLALAQNSDKGGGGAGLGLALYIDALFAMYCLVRFIHWAWSTPIPFARSN